MNRYYNHRNAFVPGTVVRADEANDELDAIEVGFDRVEGIAITVEKNVEAKIGAELRSELAAHVVSATSALNQLRTLTTDEAVALRALAVKGFADLQKEMDRAIKLQPGKGNSQLPGRGVHSNSIPYVDAHGDMGSLEMPNPVALTDWLALYLGRLDKAPADNPSDRRRIPKGAMYYNNILHRMETYDGKLWHPLVDTPAKITISETEPLLSQAGDLWFDSTTSDLMIRYADGDSIEWVVLNSNYNSLYGPDKHPILADGSTPMLGLLELSPDDPGPKDAVSRDFLQREVRTLAGPSAIYTPHITSGVNPSSALPSTVGTAKAPVRYDVRIAGTMLFFGNPGAMDKSYLPPLAGQVVAVGDFVISNGVEWLLVRAKNEGLPGALGPKGDPGRIGATGKVGPKGAGAVDLNQGRF